MRIEWDYFRQAGKQKNVYRFVLVLLLFFFLYRYYYLFGTTYTRLPWTFTSGVGFSFGQLLLQNTMPIIFFVVGTLLPFEHFTNYLIESRILASIRQTKNRGRYWYYLLFSLLYSFGYCALNIGFIMLLGYRHRFIEGGPAVLLLVTLLALVALFALFNQTSFGNIVAIFCVIILASTTTLIRWFEMPLISWGGLLVLLFIISIVANSVYLNREIY